MARFKGRAAARPDLFVPVAIVAVVIVVLVLLIWSLVDPTGFTVWREGLLARR
jgi:hypothetical protein